MAFFCHQPWKKCMWWGRWNSEAWGCKSKFASCHNRTYSNTKTAVWMGLPIQNVHFYITKEEVMAHKIHQNRRFEGTKTVPGTWSHHCYIPSSNKSLAALQISGDDLSFTAELFTTSQTLQTSPVNTPGILQLQPGQYIACKYDGKCWVANIRDISLEHEDVLVSFMHPHAPARSFQWPEREDVCWVPITAVLNIIGPPITTNGLNITWKRKTKPVWTNLLCDMFRHILYKRSCANVFLHWIQYILIIHIICAW